MLHTNGEISLVLVAIVRPNFSLADNNTLQFLPCQSIMNFYDVKKASDTRDKVHQLEKKYHDQHKSFLPQLSPGDQVLIQNPKTGLWDKQAEIIAIRPDGLSYTVRCEEREFLRSRRMIRSLPSEPPTFPDVLHSAPREPLPIHPLSVPNISPASSCQTPDSTQERIASANRLSDGH